MALCSSCQAFDIQKFRYAAYHTLGYRLEDVERGAGTDQCTFCRFLLDQVLHSKPFAFQEVIKNDAQRGKLYIHLRLSQDGEYSTSNAINASSMPLCFNQLELYLKSRDMLPTASRARHSDELASVGLSTVCRVLVNPASEAVRASDVVGVYAGEDPASEEHYEWLAKWLTDCLGHPHCASTTSDARLLDPISMELPTRCIAVQQDSIKLRRTLGEQGAYVTLSHRWTPSTEHVSTCMQNLEHRLESLEEGELPKTFQDAIAVTRRLGLPYLWIDSLCIVQSGDDGADWRREAMKMGQYYQNSVFTISALEAFDDGFLRRRAACTPGNLVRLPYRNRSGEQVDFIYIDRRSGSVQRDYVAYVLHSTLMSRGWVLQEWLLSRRIVHYSSVGMFVECQSKDPRNEFGESVRTHSRSGLSLLQKILGDSMIDLKKSYCNMGMTSRSIYLLWARIVESYSERALTKFDSDRIVALAGVAKEIRERLVITSPAAPERNGHDIAYVAGWWLDDIHNGLLWESRNLHQYSTHPPTWSWSAFNGSVIFRSKKASMERACTVSRVILADEFSGLPHPATSGPNVSSSCDVDNKFGCLVIKGKVHLVLVGRRLENDEQARVAGYTGVGTEFSHHWRAITSPEAPSEHIGWVSLNSPHARTMIDPHQSMAAMQALHVSTERGVFGGLQFGGLGLTHDVYSILLVSPHDASGQHRENRYVRCGVGRIFKPKFFQDAEEMTLELA